MVKLQADKKEKRLTAEKKIDIIKKMDSCFRRNDDIKNLNGLCELGGKRKTKRY